jgi:16S rRNA (guanine(966)-N(2))-methyltransferase RsmD
MRIIAGSHKGARIFAPKGLDTRPTGDRVREAAFNLLGPGAAEGATVLDLFAGSGAMGLEALSRGAERATFVESDRDACRTINRNLDKLGLENAIVLCQDALTALRNDARTGTRYDLVLVDPPYRRFSSLQNALIELLPEVLAPQGTLIVETAATEEPELPLQKRTSRRYGSARLTLFDNE